MSFEDSGERWENEQKGYKKARKKFSKKKDYKSNNKNYDRNNECNVLVNSTIANHYIINNMTMTRADNKNVYMF